MANNNSGSFFNQEQQDGVTAGSAGSSFFKDPQQAGSTAPNQNSGGFFSNPVVGSEGNPADSVSFFPDGTPEPSSATPVATNPNSGAFSFASPSSSGTDSATFFEAEPVSGQPAIVDQNGTPAFNPGITAEEVRTLLDVPSTSEVPDSSGSGLSVADRQKLDSVQFGAEVNVQADWTETNANSDAYIRNKPTVTDPAVTSVVFTENTGAAQQSLSSGVLTLARNVGTGTTSPTTPGEDNRNILEIARDRVEQGFTMSNVTRDMQGLLESATITFADGSTLTHTIERLDDGRPRVLTREFWQGAFINGLISADDAIVGDSLIHTVGRPPTGTPLSTGETWEFGFATMIAVLMLTLSRGRITEVVDPLNEFSQSRGRITETSALFSQDRGRRTYTGA